MKALHTKKVPFLGQEILFETGRLATLATSSVLVTLGGTSLLATVVGGGAREDLDYFPLQVEYLERLYAGGRIKGSRWVKREGRPTDEEVLTARAIDRSVRPLFPKNYAEEVQVIVTLLSLDTENDPDILAMLAVSAALAISDIPWNGPIGVVRIGLVDGHPVINPTFAQQERSDLDLILSVGPDGVVMVEAGAHEVPEETLLQALQEGKKEADFLLGQISEFAKECGAKKRTFISTDPTDQDTKQVEKEAEKAIDKLLAKGDLNTVSDDLRLLTEELKLKFTDMIKATVVAKSVEKAFKKAMRKQIVETTKRFDGRGLEDIRPLQMEVGVLSRTHGSALFQRGNTQALTITTLGPVSLQQYLETAEGEDTKRYLHHYSALPFSFGQTGRVAGPGRREIGHGALAERALAAVIPSEEKFPYAIRVVSEIMSQNGSSSMASTCGSTLSLMDAGVPISAPVAGISVGLIQEGAKNMLITDIAGIEDFYGDMDFKVAGTTKGVTAIQVDIKVSGLPMELIGKIFAQARRAREQILVEIAKAIPFPRTTVSQYAPKVAVIHIPVEKIGEVIGSGGKTIRRLMEETQTTIDVEDDGSVSVSGVSQETVDRAIKLLDGLTREILPGEEFRGKVKRIQPFGVFVEYLPGREGLVHVSKLSPEYVADPAQIVSLGDEVLVKVDKIDEMKRVDLSVPELNPTGARAPRPGFGSEDRPRRFDRSGPPRSFPRRDFSGPSRDQNPVGQERSSGNFPRRPR